MERIGVDGKDIRIIANLYWYRKAVIRIDNVLSPFLLYKELFDKAVFCRHTFSMYIQNLSLENLINWKVLSLTLII